MTFPARLTELIEKAYAEEWGMSSPLSSYLVKNAEAIRDLVVAVRVMCGQDEGDDLEAEAQMVEALAKLEES